MDKNIKETLPNQSRMNSETLIKAKDKQRILKVIQGTYTKEIHNQKICIYFIRNIRDQQRVD